jgi:FkbM family methyltransferase
MQLDYTDVIRTRYRDRFIVYRWDDIISASLRLYGEYQQVELDMLLQLVGEDTVVYDIGSNIGYHASAFASRSKHVYCFEANPQHYKMLRMNLQEEPRCTLFNLAVSNAAGKILVEEIDVTQIGNYGMARVGTKTGVEVAMDSIDSLVTAGKILPPGLIKIDVEGHEPGVFQGAAETIKKYLPVIYFEAQESENIPELYNMLDALGYQMGWCVVRNYNPQNFNNNPDNQFGNDAIFSIVAFPPNSPNAWPLPVLGPDDTWEKLLQRSNS